MYGYNIVTLLCFHIIYVVYCNNIISLLFFNVSLEECEAGSFGSNCSQQCGNCADGGSCRHDNGVCESGCQGDYVGVQCQGQSPTLSFGETENSIMYLACSICWNLATTRNMGEQAKKADGRIHVGK